MNPLQQTITTRADLFLLHDQTLSAAKRILAEKNLDYGSGADALANFRVGAVCSGGTEGQAILARLGDKIHRLRLAAEGADLAIEENDGPDAINMIVLCMAAIRERRFAAPAPAASIADLALPPCGAGDPNGTAHDEDDRIDGACFGAYCAGKPRRRAA